MYNQLVDEKEILQSLAGTGIVAIKYFKRVGSTNDIALDWAKEGTPEFSLVVADMQTAGRGRLNRKWVTKQGEGLAFSVVLKPKTDEQIPLFSALGGIAVCEALIQTLNLHARIKWPNDVLIKGKKVCGILAEAHWEKSPIVVLGIGINVGKGSIPSAEQMNFPPTTLEAETGYQVDRTLVLTEVLKKLIKWREHMGTPDFFVFWRENLAFLGKPVQVSLMGQTIDGIIKGISEEGNLQIQKENGTTIDVEMGDVQLRPIPDPLKREGGSNHAG
jgi:BirA family transcriptional regulator, biotin operon repressor / biotin---[acetyl-CoA-carboxylase] ligase